jgi:predicted phage replisome organizer
MEVKWIKIVTNIFDDEKVRYIESLPNGDESIVIWFRILCLAGKSNSGGLLMMTDRIAYTDEMLASIFQRDIKSVQLALNIFENLEMIERIDNKIYLTNWEKHQNIESLEKIRLDTKNRVAKHRERQKAVGINECNVTVTQNVTQSNAIELEEELEIEREKDKKKTKNVYGEFNNVKLSDDEYSKLEEKGLISTIEDLSYYIKSKGDKYKSHYATILMWDKKNKMNKPQSKVVEIPDYYNQKDEEVDKAALLRKLNES